MEKQINELSDALLELMKLEIFKEFKMFVEGEVALLFLLSLAPNQMLTPKQIALDLGITKGRVTSLINSLNEKRYLEVSISSEDRRSFNICLTKEGEAFLNPKLTDARKQLEKVISILGKDKIKMLIEVIYQLKENMEE